MLHDVIVALRTFLHRPGYALSVIFTLGLGIGASTMMFSLLDAAVLRPLPFRDPEHLVSLLGVAGPARDVRGASFPEVGDWRAMNDTLEDVAIYDPTSLNMRVASEPVRVAAEMVSPAYFELLGVQAALGRTFTADENRSPDAHAVAVISHGLWRERFGARPDALSQPIFLNDRRFSIVGVMPEGFAGLSFEADVWFPTMLVSLTSSPSVIENRGTRWLTAIGRLKAGVSLERANEDLARVATILEKEYPDNHRERGVQVLSIQDAMLGTTRTLLSALFGAVLLFLLMACANVASLQLARTIARRRELAVRLALGASRWHVLRSLLAESWLLAGAAGAVGALLAMWSLSAVGAILPEGVLPDYANPALNLRTFLFAASAAMVAGTLIAILPALRSTSRDVGSALKDGTRSVDGGVGTLRRRSAQQLLVVGQLALAMTLLTGSALLVRSLERQMSVTLGFNPSGVTVARISLPAERYGPDERRAFAERLDERLRSLPGAVTSSISSDQPLTGNSSASILLTDHGTAERVRYYRHFVTPGFLPTFGVTVAHGRNFTPQDAAGSPPVAIINEAGARRLWGGAREALGRRLRLGPDVLAEIVGVVPNARFRDLTTDITAGGAEPDVFFPWSQRTDRDVAIAVRGASDAAISIGMLQEAVSGLDPGLPVYALQRLEDAVAQQTSTARFGSVLLGIFSAGALLLAAVGLYGLVSYVVGLSGRDIAVRLALGADAKGIVLLILRNGLALVVAGVVAGVAGALIAGPALQNQLFQTDSRDPVTFASVAALLIAVAAAATFVPARRASRVAPHAALRGD
jgi:putative ABC transport system permease protein